MIYGLSEIDYVDMREMDRPLLLVVIDTEEDFDWTKDFDRGNISVKSMASIGRAQTIFDKFQIHPVYVVDYPVVTQEAGYQELRKIYGSGRCEIGLHLHPWVTPPFDETLNRKNSFAGNLSAELEKSKIQTTSREIEAVFGHKPRIYKAGRYGVGPNTALILAELGFEVDLSVCPLMDFSSEGGPDFTENRPLPYWFGTTHPLLELPLTNDFTGLLRNSGRKLHSFLTAPVLNRLRAVGIAARLKILNRVCLSPEGYDVSEMIALTRTLFKAGVRIFTFNFHSPSLVAGNTPYVRDSNELTAFLYKFEAYFDFFMDKLKGEAITPLALRKRLLQLQKDDIQEKI